jgi:penicillin-binding protein 1C
MQRVLVGTTLLLIILLASYLLCPKPELLPEQGYSRAFLDRNQKLLRLTLAEDQRYRLHISLDKVSPLVQQATVLYEDQNYYQHAGIDILALFRAFRDTYLLSRHKSGASTITMQVARLRWKLKTNNISGKILQIFRALQLNRHFSKQQILQAYFNLAPYGRNIEGIAAASLIYFNKAASDLSLPEALTLSVIPQNPVHRNPTTQRGFSQLLKARANLFDRWLKSHPQDRHQSVFMELPLQVRKPENLPFFAPHFVNSINQQLPHFNHGNITTTINLDQQNKLESIVNNYISKQRRKGIVNTTVMLLNYRNMEVEGLVGSANFFDAKIAGQVNGSHALRSPGSTLKPFVYALAMDQGLIHPMSLLKDTPKRFGGFSPENFDQRFLGPVFAKDALIKSRNVPAVNLLANLQQPDFYQLLLSAGIDHLKNREHYGLALVLGGAELSMQELVKLYAMLANQGELKAIKTLLKTKPTNASMEPKKLLSAEASFLTLDILKDNPPPEAYLQTPLIGQSVNTNQIAWKTGTSYGFRDAWAIGISGDYVVAVWVGNFNGQGNQVFVGRTAAGPLLFDIFQAINPANGWQIGHSFTPHQLNLKKIAVCTNTGDLPGKYCPSTTQSWFIPGVSPIKVSTVHRAIPIDKKSGLRHCEETGNSELKIYEFWPSDLQQIFKQAGLSFKQPPEFAKDCHLHGKSTSGLSPVINSPQQQLTYVMQADNSQSNQLPLSAVVDTGVKQLFWFADNRYIGQTNTNQPLFWKPKSGHYTLKVVDDHGRSAQMKLRVVFQ